jgi:pimeloyl-ACP methyl ester carboxylesterase
MNVRTHVVRLSLVAAAAWAVPAAAASAQTHASGAIGPGSTYEIDAPASWNGDLVLYAHGIVQADQPVAAPAMQDGFSQFRSALLASGYAVAASSFSSNGWSLDDAVRRTHQLRGIVEEKIGQPRRVYLAGHSMGALAITRIVEEFAGQYDGALPMCGPLGGALRELQYAGDARVTFDAYFPGVLPGSAFDVPAGTQYLSPFEPGGPSALFLQVYAAIAANPQKTVQWAAAAKLPYASATELGTSALYVVGFVLRYTNDFIERVNGKMPFDNRLTSYRVDITNDLATNNYLSAQLNDAVVRYDADQAALNYYGRNYEPSGRIGVPVLTLHTSRDPGIPAWHEDRFKEVVGLAGRADFLSQRSFNRFGHCAFTPAEVTTAFDDLVTWVTTGQKP